VGVSGESGCLIGLLEDVGVVNLAAAALALDLGVWDWDWELVPGLGSANMSSLSFGWDRFCPLSLSGLIFQFLMVFSMSQ